MKGHNGRIWIVALTVMCGACTSTPNDTGVEGQLPGKASRSATGASPSPAYALGEFPGFPDGALSGLVAEALQAALDTEIEAGTFTGSRPR